MNLSGTMKRVRKMLPARKRGMGTGSKILLMAAPVVLFVAGKMISSRLQGDDH
ncbi:MAG TPA: hypothetical protein PLY40_06420 [Bacillota bacterium]|nr:hypothetical protein [Bacillota bacterium]